MNVNFKLAWFEDEDSAFEAHYEEFKAIIESFDLIADITRYRDNNIDIDEIKNVDLILADYDLGIANGVDLINDSIRGDKIVIDALLYSSKYDRMVEEIRKVNPLLEGVFCAKRGSEDLNEKLTNLIFRIVKRAQSLENLRGLVMEYSSIFDVKILGLIHKYATIYYDEIINYLNTSIAKSKKEGCFKTCSKNRNNSKDYVCSKLNDCCYCFYSSNLDCLENMDMYDKSRVLNNIINRLISDNRIMKKEIFERFHEHFNEEIIIYRNALAHEKSDKDKLYIQAKKNFAEINDGLFSQIKRSIKKYLSIFSDLESLIDCI